jgi:hypothetical protein
MWSAVRVPLSLVNAAFSPLLQELSFFLRVSLEESLNWKLVRPREKSLACLMKSLDESPQIVSISHFEVRSVSEELHSDSGSGGALTLNRVQVAASMRYNWV